MRPPRRLGLRLAADELNLTQGAVAQQVRRRESEFRYRLSCREACGLASIEICHRYHNAVRRAPAIIDDATAKLRPGNIHVLVSVIPSFASEWLLSVPFSGYHSALWGISGTRPHQPLRLPIRTKL